MFMLFFGIAIVAFLFGLRNLYWYYKPSVRDSVEITTDHNRITTNAELAFGSLVLQRIICAYQISQMLIDYTAMYM